MRCLVCLLTVILLPVMALAEGPIQNYSIDWEKDGNQYHVRTRMWNTTTLRYTFWQGTNAWAATGYTFKWHGAKSDSASSTIQVSGSINTNFSASNVVDFTFTSNQLSRTAEDWFSEVVVTAGSAVYSRPRGQLDIERSPGVNSASALALTAAIAGPSYGPFTGSFTGWPFATSTEFSSSVTSVTDTASITNSQVGQILSVYFKTPWGDVRYARSNVVAGLSTSVGNISNDLDGAETSLGNISNTVDGLTTSVGNISNDLDGAETSLGNVSNDLDGLSTSVGNISNTVDGITTSLGNVSNTVDGLANSVGNISNDLDGAETSLGNISNTVDGLLPRDGSLPPTGNFDWGGFNIDNVNTSHIRTVFATTVQETNVVAVALPVDVAQGDIASITVKGGDNHFPGAATTAHGGHAYLRGGDASVPGGGASTVGGTVYIRGGMASGGAAPANNDGGPVYIQAGTNSLGTKVNVYVEATNLVIEGNVGIGTNAPSEALEVVGNVQATGSIAAPIVHVTNYEVYDILLAQPAYVTNALIKYTFDHKEWKVYHDGSTVTTNWAPVGP